MSEIEKKRDSLEKPEVDITEGVTEYGPDEQKLRDIAGELYLEVQQYPREELEAEGKKVLRKIDKVILPVICITCMLHYLDKLSLNYASAYTLKEDLGLEGQRYSWTAAVFNFGYLFWSIPANILLQKLPVAKFTGFLLLGWAVVLVCHVAAKNYAGLLVLRFVMGMFEASISPLIMTITSMFYARDEQPFRMCLFLAFNGVATMLGALLSYGLGNATGSLLKTWQLIFLVIGALNVVWGILFLILTPDSPSTAKFLTHKEKVVAINRIATNMIGVKNAHFQTKQSLEALTDPKVWCLTLIGLACGIINGGVSNFSSALLEGFGLSGLNATLLQLPSGAIEAGVVPLCGLAASRFKDTRALWLVVSCLPPLAGLIGIQLTSLAHRWTLVGCSWLQYIFGAAIILAWNLLTTNVAGHSKRALATGLWFVFYAAGNVAGAQVFLAREAPRYHSAIIALSVCYAGIIVAALVLRQLMWWENRRRDGSSTVVDEATRDGFMDLTDRENPGFRYAL
ncbi:allantoin permease [Phyllosticta capitalensis]|uniref:Allantoin permease n=1 Tax=Phyllosticta capitalensis TaxID=121624 RepID=A0ABR1YJ65_9PEZI